MDTEIVIVRHGQTEWSRVGKHTGRTDIPLTAQGENEAALVGPTLQSWDFVNVVSSPLIRAQRTAELSNVPNNIELRDELVEWDYGIHEGRTNTEITADLPGWSKWSDPLEGGETASDVGARADAAIERLLVDSADGPVLVFAHGHLLAILIARWLGLDAAEGKRFILETATVSMLGSKRGDHVIRMLNQRCTGSPLDR